MLGLVVTLTHTGIVIVLGVLSTVAAAYFVPDTVRKVLEIVSGALIVGVGAWMIGVRVGQARRHRHGHDHDDAQDQGHNEEHGRGRARHGEHAHTDHGGHSHRGHDHGHGHSHGPVLKPGQRPSLWQLMTLGISGGIVPCPAALAVLLAAISFGNFLRAVSLVIIFGLGMAGVLVAIGIMMVHAAKFAGKYVAESRWTKVVPIISAILITLVGVGLTVKAIADVLR